LKKDNLLLQFSIIFIKKEFNKANFDL